LLSRHRTAGVFGEYKATANEQRTKIITKGDEGIDGLSAFE